MNKKIFVYAGLIILVILILNYFYISGELSEVKINNKINPDDFDIIISYGTPYDDNYYFNYDYNDLIPIWFTLKITALYDNKGDLYYKIYDKSINKDITNNIPEGYPKIFYKNNEYEEFVSINDITLKSIDESKDIEVCLSSKENFNKNEVGVVCKSIALPERKIDIEISPDPIEFIFSKSSIGIKSSFGNLLESMKTITIKNTGTIPIRVCPILPFEFSESHSKTKPQYVGDFLHAGEGTQSCENLIVGQNTKYNIKASIWSGNITELEFDTPAGEYVSEGIVGSLFKGLQIKPENAYYKKLFSIKTIITE